MISLESIQSYAKEDLPVIAEKLEAADIEQLVAWLNEKNDTIRYPSFLLLEDRSANHNDVYPYWHTFTAKFASPNSFQRSLGLMMVAANVKWDRENKFETILERYLSFFDDEKPVTVRQCIQSLAKIVPYKPALLNRISDKLMAIDIAARKESQRKILLMDILTILILINRQTPREEINRYIHQAMTGGLLDKKGKSTIENLIQNTV